MLIGRITKDLELSYTSTNKAVCDFSIAVNRDKENADFINIQAIIPPLLRALLPSAEWYPSLP